MRCYYWACYTPYFLCSAYKIGWSTKQIIRQIGSKPEVAQRVSWKYSNKIPEILEFQWSGIFEKCVTVLDARYNK